MDIIIINVTRHIDGLVQISRKSEDYVYGKESAWQKKKSLVEPENKAHKTRYW